MQTTRRQNQWIADVASFYKNVSVVNIRDFVLSEAEVHTPYHFDRLVYYRLFVHIRDWISGAHTLRDSVGWAVHRTKNPETYLNSNLSAHALSRTAKFLLGNGRPHIALLFARQASQIEPETLTHCLVLIEALVASGKPLTLEDILPVIQTKGISGEALHQLGMSCFGAGRLELAATLFKHASSIEPLILHHRHRLANVLERQNKRLEALAILSSCMQDGDVNPHIRANVGRLLMDFGRSDEVAGSLKGWLRDDPDFVPYHALQLELDRQHRSASTG
jgi:tetratricopeptide (TPR) repeat protein